MKTESKELDKKTHYRKAFNSPYLSSADIVEPTILKIARVTLDNDKTKKTKDIFNTAYFAEKEIRPGEKLKPMILNATNSRTMKALTGSPYIDDWHDIYVTVYVDTNVKMMGSVVEGLRISTEKPRLQKPSLEMGTPSWANAIAAYQRDGNFDAIEKRVTISDEYKDIIIKEAGDVS